MYQNDDIEKLKSAFVPLPMEKAELYLRDLKTILPRIALAFEQLSFLEQDLYRQRNNQELHFCLDFSDNNIIFNNSIIKGEHGIRLRYSNNNSITENIIEDHDYYGIFLSNSENNIVYPNTFSNNKQDIKEELKP